MVAGYLPAWARSAEKNIPGEPFFGGAKINVVDLKLHMAVRWFIGGKVDHIPATIFAGYPKLMRVHDAVRDHPGVKSWYRERRLCKPIPRKNEKAFPIMIIDSQVHAYAANTPQRPWHKPPQGWPDHVTGDEMVAAMDKVGVDGAIMVSPNSLYGYDASYAIDVQRA